MRHQNHLGIQLRTTKAQRFSTDLVELPVAPTLGPLVAEHRAHVIQALAAVVEQGVFNRSAHHAGCVFRAHGELVTIELVFKRIHLFLDDVGDLAQAADKQGGVLHDGRADVLVGIGAHQAAHRVLQGLPARRIGRQDIVHAFDGREFLCLRRGREISHAVPRWKSGLGPRGRSACGCSFQQPPGTRWQSRCRAASCASRHQ